MKALSVKQPWSSLIATGHKKIEVRTWTTKYRGPVLICSSLKSDRFVIERMKAAGRGRLSARDILMVSFDALPLGQALAVVNLTDCRPMTQEDESSAWVPFKDGLWAWVLEDVQPLKPFAVKGRLGLWNYQGECCDCRDVFKGRDEGCVNWFCSRDSGWYPADSLWCAT